MSNDKAPFSIGQKVVSLIENSMIKLDSIHTVLGIRKGCHTWFIDIGLVSPVDLAMQCRVCKSPLIIQKGGEFWPEAKCFAPYNPYSNSVSKELAEKAMNVGDGADQPVKIKEPALS